MAKTKRFECMSDNCRFEQEFVERLNGVVDLIKGDVDGLVQSVLTPAFLDYWFQLINEKPAADFLDLTDRTLQKYRQQGGGPPFVRISSRCVRYRRVDLRRWAEDRLRSSTSEMD